MPPVKDNPVQQLIFWFLGALFVVMTSIGGFAAQHLVTEVDSLASRLSIIEQNNAQITESRDDMKRRLERIENKLDAISRKY